MRLILPRSAAMPTPRCGMARRAHTAMPLRFALIHQTNEAEERARLLNASARLLAPPRLPSLRHGYARLAQSSNQTEPHPGACESPQQRVCLALASFCTLLALVGFGWGVVHFAKHPADAKTLARTVSPAPKVPRLAQARRFLPPPPPPPPFPPEPPSPPNYDPPPPPSQKQRRRRPPPPPPLAAVAAVSVVENGSGFARANGLRAQNSSR